MAPDLPKGISERHARGCRRPKGGRCNCEPGHQAQVWDSNTQRRVSKTFSGPNSLDEAVDWRAEKKLEISRGVFRPGRAVSIRVAMDELFEGMRAGVVRNRSGDPYKASSIRGYEQGARDHLLRYIGSARIAELRGSDVQRLVTRMIREGLGASTIRNSLLPLRVLYRQAIALDEVAASPVAGVQLPAVRGRRLLIVPPAEAELLIRILAKRDRALWATAFYAGLRLGELQALDLADVDLATGVIKVRDNWDRVDRERIDPKSEAGVRRVPIAVVLRDYLVEHKQALDWEKGLIFGRTAELPFTVSAVQKRADRIWLHVNAMETWLAERQEREPQLLTRVTLHDCRHTYASLMIAAGVNPKALSTYMGHAQIAITWDRYGHLFPGNEDEAAQLLDDYLLRANTAARRAAVGAE